MAPFRLYPPFLGRPGGPGPVPALRPGERHPEQLDDLRRAVFPIPRLVARLLAHHQQATLGVQARLQDLPETREVVPKETHNAIQIHPHLDFGGQFVDVLAAGTGSADGLGFQGRFRHQHAIVYDEIVHAPNISRPAPRHARRNDDRGDLQAA